jgi:hypothetical protein
MMLDVDVNASWTPVLKYICNKRWYSSSLQDRWGHTGIMGASGLKLKKKKFVPGLWMLRYDVTCRL